MGEDGGEVGGEGLLGEVEDDEPPPPQEASTTAADKTDAYTNRFHRNCAVNVIDTSAQPIASARVNT